MANRILKDSIWTSPNFNQLSVLAERHFYRVLLLADDYGAFEATAAVVRGRCYPLQAHAVSERDVHAWQEELGQRGILEFWYAEGRLWARFVTFDKHNAKYAVTRDGKPTRHRRKTPEPPDVCHSSPSLAALERTVSNPNHNPVPSSSKRADVAAPSSGPADDLVGHFCDKAYGHRTTPEQSSTGIKFVGICRSNGLDPREEVERLSARLARNGGADSLCDIPDPGEWFIRKVLRKAAGLKRRRSALKGLEDGF